MIITNARVLSKNKLIDHGEIRISGDFITEVGIDQNLQRKYPQDELFNAFGQLVLPGNICAHTHFYGAFSRGLSIPGEAPEAFLSILKKLWWNLDKSLDSDAILYSTLVSLISAIRYGTTTLIDHHASPNFIAGSLDVIEKAVLQSGLRACLCYEVTDRDGERKANQGIEENLRFIEKCKNVKNPRIDAMFGMHAGFTLNEDTLRKISRYASNDVGFHMHVAEHVVDEMDSLSKYGKRVVDRLDSHGLLNNKTLLAHAVYVDTKELEIIRSRGCWVSHQPRSNMNNAVGLPNVESMDRYGIKLCLGNDGFSNAMWQEWKAAYFGHKLFNRDPRVLPADMIAKIAMVNNGKLVSSMFDGRETGVIEEDSAADLIIVDYKPFTDLTFENLPWHVVFGFEESMITTTMCGGNILKKDGKIINIDEDLILKEALKVSKFVWKKYQQVAG